MKPKIYKMSGYGVEIIYKQYLSTREEQAYTTIEDVDIVDKQELFEHLVHLGCNVVEMDND
jgi:hypothetical protein